LTDWSVKEKIVSAIIVDKKEKQKNIIQSAARVFSQKGFARTTVSDIAQEAGIGKGTFYEYFESKEVVIYLAFEYFMEELVPDFKGIVQKSISASEKISLMIKGFSRILQSKEKQDLLSLTFDIWAEGIRSQPHRKSIEMKMKQFYKDYREPVVKVLEQGIQSGEFRSDIKTEVEASVLVGLLDGLMVQWILDREKFPIQSALGAAVATILNGILRQNNTKNKKKKVVRRD
jgi:TetR/AcrR family fatty acid metabolism transcriptional regulator